MGPFKGILSALHYLNTVSDEAEHSSKPQEKSESSEEILTELDPFRSRWWRGQRVEAVLLVTLGSPIFGEAAIEVGVETFAEFVEAHTVDIELEFLFEGLKVFPCKQNRKSINFAVDQAQMTSYIMSHNVQKTLPPLL